MWVCQLEDFNTLIRGSGLFVVDYIYLRLVRLRKQLIFKIRSLQLPPVFAMDRHVHIRSFNPDDWVLPDSKHYPRFRNITRAALGLERLTVNSHGLFEALSDAFGAKQTDMDKYLNQKVSVIRDLFPKQLASTSPYLSDFDTKTYFNQFHVDPAQLKRAMLKVAGEGGPEVVVNGDEVRERSASEGKADGESDLRTFELNILFFLLAQLPLLSPVS
jgi:hypothetical protein